MFWQWERLGSYLEFLAGLIVILTISHFVLGRFKWCVQLLPTPLGAVLTGRYIAG